MDALDAEVDDILAREAARREAAAAKTKDAGDTLHKALNVAYARVDREHRLATEHVEIRTHDCS